MKMFLLCLLTISSLAEAAPTQVVVDFVRSRRQSSAPSAPSTGYASWYVLDSDGKFYVKNSSNTAKSCTYSGEIVNADLSGSAGVANANLAAMVQATIKGRASGAGTGTPTDLSGTQVAAIVDAFTGDSGSGGVKGAVPAPSTGDAAANKYLHADGTWKGVCLTRTLNAQTGTTYTFALSDGSNAGNCPLVTSTNASAQTFTVPPNSSVAYPTGTQIDVCQMGAGKPTFAEGSGVTINSKSSNKAIGGQYVCVSLVKTATNTWLLIGDLIP